MDHEFNANAASALDHGWRVRDVITGLAVDVLPGFPDFSIPDGTIIPTESYNNNTVFGRALPSHRGPDLEVQSEHPGAVQQRRAHQ